MIVLNLKVPRSHTVSWFDSTMDSTRGRQKHDPGAPEHRPGKTFGLKGLIWTEHPQQPKTKQNVYIKFEITTVIVKDTVQSKVGVQI